MKTRCKVVCLYKQDHSYETVRWENGREIRTRQPGSVEIRVGAVYQSEPGSENHAFWKATPSLSLTMFVDNRDATEMFEVGKEFYLDFVPAS